MRMRLKKWARPELAVRPFFIGSAPEQKGRWGEAFPREQPLWAEMGCGKGGFLSAWALSCPEVNFLGIDMISDMLGVARRRIQADFDQAGRPVDNLRLTCYDISRLEECMGGGDRLERIFINFCNPWNKPKHYKRRLTHPRQLEKYRSLLKDEGEIWFKTDDPTLFRHSLQYFQEMGFAQIYQTDDLHQSGFSPNVETEHEIMYSQQGMPIHFAIVRKAALPEEKFVHLSLEKTSQPS